MSRKTSRAAGVLLALLTPGGLGFYCYGWRQNKGKCLFSAGALLAWGLSALWQGSLPPHESWLWATPEPERIAASNLLAFFAIVLLVLHLLAIAKALRPSGPRQGKAGKTSPSRAAGSASAEKLPLRAKSKGTAVCLSLLPFRFWGRLYVYRKSKKAFWLCLAANLPLIFLTFWVLAETWLGISGAKRAFSPT